jgi:hypothetical protein
LRSEPVFDPLIAGPSAVSAGPYAVSAGPPSDIFRRDARD